MGMYCSNSTACECFSLSFSSDAEQRCYESCELAARFAPDNPEAHQLRASCLLSMQRNEVSHVEEHTHTHGHIHSSSNSLGRTLAVLAIFRNVLAALGQVLAILTAIGTCPNSSGTSPSYPYSNRDVSSQLWGKS